MKPKRRAVVSTVFWVLGGRGRCCNGFLIGTKSSLLTPPQQRCKASSTRSLLASTSRSNGINGVGNALRNDQETVNGETERTESDFMVNQPSLGSAAALQAEPPFRENLYILSVSGLVGILSGLAIVVFKTLIQVIREVCYTDVATHSDFFTILLPMVGGIGVGLLVLFFGEFAPGLRGTIREVDAVAVKQRSRWNANDQKVATTNDNLKDVDTATAQAAPTRSVLQESARAMRKTIGAALTLGTGNSLGPEGPSVEAGMAVSRFCGSLRPMQVLFGNSDSYQNNPTIAIVRNRLFLSCGAAAGVAAGFNAPLAGVFFALEIVQGAFPSIDVERRNEATPATTSSTASNDMSLQSRLAVDSINISPILLSSVIAALVVKNLLGNELALSVPAFELRNPLLELPIYLLLGVLSGILASLFSGAAQTSKAFFDGVGGSSGTEDPSIRTIMHRIPTPYKPILGSLFCGCVGAIYPQTLFFGYDTLNALLAVQTFPTSEAMQLLVAKFATTTVAAASGLVGGTFAPSLFLGGMLGAAYHNIVEQLVDLGSDNVLVWLTASTSSSATTMMAQTEFLSGTPAYTMVGGACVLAALFRAPLTATLLLFECTRNYDVILPLMASAGVASLIADIVEQALEEQRRDDDAVSWGDLAMKVATIEGTTRRLEEATTSVGGDEAK